MFSLKTKIGAVAGAALLVIGLPLYGFFSMRSHMDDRITVVEHEVQAVRAQNAAKIQEMSSDLNYVAEKMAITARDLDHARKLTENLKRENAQSAQKLRGEIASHSKVMNQFRQEAAAKLEEVQQEATTKIGTVSGEVQNVRVDLDASRKEIGEMRDTLSRQIAHNSSELAELRRRGERDYFEFDVHKSRDAERIADVKLQLRKADTKRQKFDVVLFVDDYKLEKKDRLVNEPVTFLVGREQLRYELVVNYVDKDRIRGYVSAPKDKVLSAERPAFRGQQ